MEVDFLTTIVQLMAGAFIGACIGMTGIGGGVLILPVLTIWFGLPPSVAVGTAHFYSFLCKLPAVFFHFRQGTIRFLISAYFLMGAIPMNVIVAIYLTGYAETINPTSHDWLKFQEALRIFIAIIVILSGGFLLWHVIFKQKNNPIKGDKDSIPITGNKITIVILLGGIIGGLIAATSVGSGILIVPLFIIILGLAAVDTVGSSIFIALLLTSTSSIIYAGSNQLDLTTAITMAAGSFLGVPIGVRMSKKIPEHFLQITITTLVLAAGLFMLVDV